ncbi:hypothetical protein P154DRAFT_624086 [Amniculicola lignicola CBS 123094]|uniref:Acyltransferase 3 domain-containing protein n=1 Tax=Amniculicola lignicola CBS 123094 TaxID=1392246 RepID=A0A6A5WCG6_9PLEO|nr:hypothetical protein P154DRAFT_624086 [Amniculicola lignicola CBS 123094]
MAPHRSYYLDNLRTALTVLVIYHHTAIPYGGLGSWPYPPPSPSSHASSPHPPSLPLACFNLVNQTYFMATFFLLSGYFSALTVSRKKSRWVWMGEKWRRLGVPTILYSVFGPAVVRGVITTTTIVLRNGDRSGGGGDGKGRINGDLERVIQEVWSGLWEWYEKGGVQGPVWYCAVLLVFDMFYAAICPRDFVFEPRLTPISTSISTHATANRVAPGEHIRLLVAENDGGGEERTQNEHAKKQRGPSTRMVLMAVCLSSTTAFFLRVPYPLGTGVFALLNLRVGYMPQYILFYSTGLAAYRYWDVELHFVVSKQTRVLLLAWLLAIGLSWILVLRNTLADVKDVLEGSDGGINTFALLYAFGNEVSGVLISSGSLALFKTKFDRKWIVGGVDLTRHSYAAFLLHPPCLVFLQCVLDGWNAGGVLKTVVVGSLGTVVTWVTGWVLVQAVGSLGFRGYV